MFRHCVLFKFKAGTSAETLARIAAQLELLSHLEMIRGYQFGADAGIADGNYDFAVVADFDNEDGYRRYAQDPKHQQVLEEHLRPNIAERAAVQYHFAARE